MNEEKKGFNLSVLISLLVGVISLIVVIPSISMIMNKATEVAKPEEYRIIVSKNYSSYFHFIVSDIETENTETESILLTDFFHLYDNLISITSTSNAFVMTVSCYDENDLNYFYRINIGNATYNSASYTFTYLDPVSNDKLYGTYDFSNIILTENNQVLNPIYTPF